MRADGDHKWLEPSVAAVMATAVKSGSSFEIQCTQACLRLLGTLKKHGISEQEFTLLVGGCTATAKMSAAQITLNARELMYQQWVNALWYAGLLSLNRVAESCGVQVSSNPEFLEEILPLEYEHTSMFPMLGQY